jgi:ectoine hydroxylase-related dioxygenase (phytanoyl-CoA dioxygenase family)
VQPPLEVLKQMVTLRFHLDACDADNGPLRVIAATHHRILNQNEIDGLTTESTQTICTVAAGGLVLMRPLLLHASSPAENVRHRRVIHVEYGPPTLPGGLNWAIAGD